MSDSKAVYVCHTVYHVYISALKALEMNAAPAIVLVDTIPSVDDLAERLRAEGLFSDVSVVRKGELFVDAHSYHVNRLYATLMRASLKRKLPYLFEGGAEIYLFNDYTEIGALLNLAGKRYHLIEDGCDCYKNWDQSKPFGKAKAVKEALWRLFKIPPGLGHGPNVIDLEVNDAEGLKSSFGWPVVEVPRRALMTGLSKGDVDKLMRAFDAQCLRDVKPGSVLVLTGPLWELGVVSSQRENAELFMRMAACYPGRDVYVKPHPRDTWDYSSLFPEGRVLKSSVPIELLNCLGEGVFDVAATWCSTAANSLWACKRVVLFDPDDHRPNVEHATLPKGGDGCGTR